MEELKSGDVLGHYKVEELLGKGGMGNVYKAWDMNLKRYVALKILRGDDPVQLKRFLLEASSQAKVDHEYVCKVYEAGNIDNRPFIAMQYIEGETLIRMSDLLTLEEKVRLMADVSLGLHAAHTTGLIHRDIKPDNIMVTRSEEGQWKAFVMDFGIAREQAASGLTSTGMVVGTPFYMSPEHARGKISQLDRRGDIYSLGVTLYELVGGTVPFTGETPLEILLQVVRDEPPSLRKLNPHIPQDLETIIMKCLEKEPQRRYRSAKELADDLRNFLAGDPITARPTTVMYRIKRKIIKHKLLSAIGVAALLVILFLGGLWIKTGIDAAKRAQIAQELGREVTEIENTIRYAYFLPLHDISHEKNTIRKRIESLAGKVETLGSYSRGPAHFAMGQGYKALQETAKAREHLQQAWEADYQTPQVAVALGEVLGELYLNETTIAERIEDRTLKTARQAELDRLYREPALRFLKEGITTPAEANDYIRALIAFYDKKYDQALDLLRSFIPKTRDDIQWQFKSKLLEGNTYLAQAAAVDDFQGYHRLLAKAQEAFQHVTQLGPSDIRGYRGLIRCLERKLSYQLHSRAENIQQLVTEANDLCQKALRIDPSEADIYVVKSSINRWLGRYHAFTGQDPLPAYSEAEQAAEKAIQLQPENYEAMAAMGAVTRYKAEYVSGKGQDSVPLFQLSIQYFQKAAEINPTYPIAYQGIGTSYVRIAENLISHGQEAREYLRESITNLEKAIACNPQFGDSHNSLGLAYMIQAEAEASRGEDPRPSYRKAGQSLDNSIALTPNTAYLYNNQGFIHLEIARYELENGYTPLDACKTADEYFNKSLEINKQTLEGYLGLMLGEGIRSKYDFWLKKDFKSRYPKISEYFKKGVAVNPEYAVFYSRKAAILFLLVYDLMEADSQSIPAETLLNEIKALRDKAYSINPNLVDCFILDAQLLLVTARQAVDGKDDNVAARSFAGANQALKKAAEINPRDAEIYLIESRYAWQKAEWEKARGRDNRATLRSGLETLRRGIEINPHLAEFYAWKGILLTLAASAEPPGLQADKMKQEAGDAFREALRINKNLRPRYERFFTPGK